MSDLKQWGIKIPEPTGRQYKLRYLRHGEHISKSYVVQNFEEKYLRMNDEKFIVDLL